MPQYRYALNEAREVVDICELPHNTVESRGSFLCISCEQPLVAKTRGQHREKHFAHKVAAPSCSTETYLHRLAKQMFYSVYQECLAQGVPFTFQLAQPRTCCRYSRIIRRDCQLPPALVPYDITRYYDGVRLEARDGSFIPDLLLYHQADPERKIYVEIAVTHTLSDSKSESGHRIVEISIQHEDDIGKIASRNLSEQDARFVNFPRKVVMAGEEDCACASREFYCLFIYRNGKSFLVRDTISRLMAEHKRLKEKLHTVRFVRPDEPLDRADFGTVFRVLVQKAQESGIPVRNCFLCRYVGEKRDFEAEGSVFCKHLRVNCNSNRAAECEFYRLQRKEGEAPYRKGSASESRSQYAPARMQPRPEPARGARRSGDEAAFGIQNIFARWPRVLLAVQEMDEGVGATLAVARPVYYSGGVLTLRFANWNQYKQIGDPGTCVRIENMLSDIYGFPVYLRGSLDESAAPE